MRTLILPADVPIDMLRTHVNHRHLRFVKPSGAPMPFVLYNSALVRSITVSTRFFYPETVSADMHPVVEVELLIHWRDVSQESCFVWLAGVLVRPSVA